MMVLVGTGVGAALGAHATPTMTLEKSLPASVTDTEAVDVACAIDTSELVPEPTLGTVVVASTVALCHVTPPTCKRSIHAQAT